MKNTFKQYHQFTEAEFKQLWENCLFVFDTNTLLNMYRYSRSTVDAYFKVLKNLKKKKQLWIPYQAGYEFYENRIDIIYEYEGSYDTILSILDKAKKDIEESYKNHPFLDLKRIKRKMDIGLKSVESEINSAKKDHPKWMEKDDVLDEINDLFKDSIGTNYDDERIREIKAEGKERYEKKIPPGYKDDKKSEDKKYGDLILWYQIIDKAKESKKPIILISGDVKEDWWLEKDGKRIMPLPQLKKEIYDKAEVDFHIYTADRFLEFYDGEKNKKAISEVRKIRELEELRMMHKRKEMIVREHMLNNRMFEGRPTKHLLLFEELERLLMEISHGVINPRYTEEIDQLIHRLRIDRSRTVHGVLDRKSLHRTYAHVREFTYVFNKMADFENISPELLMRIRMLCDRFEQLVHY